MLGSSIPQAPGLGKALPAPATALCPPQGHTERQTPPLCLTEVSQFVVWPGLSALSEAKLSSPNSHARESAPVTKTTIKAAGLCLVALRKTYIFWGLNSKHHIILDYFPFFSLKLLLREKTACHICFSIHLPLPLSSTYPFLPLLIHTEKWIWN